MAEHSSSRDSGAGSTSLLAFLVGGLLVAAAVVVWLFLAGGVSMPSKSVDINVNLPSPSAPNVPVPTVPSAPQ
jgi:hypothetical protein